VLYRRDEVHGVLAFGVGGGGGPCRLVHVVPGRNTRLISNTEVIYHHTIHTYLLNSVSSARRTIKTPLNALRQTAAPSARPPAIITNNTRYVVYADGVRCNSSPRCLRLAMVEEWRFPGTQIIMYFIERLWLSPGGAVLLRLSYHVVVIDNKYIVSIGPCRVGCMNSTVYRVNMLPCTCLCIVVNDRRCRPTLTYYISSPALLLTY